LTDSLVLLKELAVWVRNNWRPYSTVAESKVNLRVNAIDVVWETRKAAVEEKIKEILQVEDLEDNQAGYFQQRTAATKRVLEEMTEQGRHAVNRIVEDRREQGHPEHIRRE
jgi:hypothetical protein